MIITMLIVGMILGAGGMAMLVSGHVKRTQELREEISQAYANIQAQRTVIEALRGQIELLKGDRP